MELLALYNYIQNPLDDPEVIKKIIQAYSNATNNDFYTFITRINNKPDSTYDIQDADYFHAMMFNNWKKNVLSITQEDFIKLREQRYYYNDFLSMQNYLRAVPDVKTRQEANRILYGNQSAEIGGALRNYNWASLGKNSSWTHVHSCYSRPHKDIYFPIEHRLYLSTQSSDTYKLIILFVEKCDKYQIPYYFKYVEKANRDDNIVIYSDSEKLTKYIDVLQEIKREKPELVARCGEPPILTGKIDRWIGYGVEPTRGPDGNLRSYNEVRTESIEIAMQKVVQQWIILNAKLKLNYNGKIITFLDYLGLQFTQEFINDLYDKYKKYGSSIGVFPEDLQSKGFFDGAYQIIQNNMERMLTELGKIEPSRIQPAKMIARDNKIISANYECLQIAMQKLASFILSIDNNFITYVKKSIEQEAEVKGIDVIKYCFDVGTKEKMAMYDETKSSYQSGNNKKQVMQVKDFRKKAYELFRGETIKKNSPALKK